MAPAAPATRGISDRGRAEGSVERVPQVSQQSGGISSMPRSRPSSTAALVIVLQPRCGLPYAHDRKSVQTVCALLPGHRSQSESAFGWNSGRVSERTSIAKISPPAASQYSVSRYLRGSLASSLPLASSSPIGAPIS
jgi:hypothetical protein